MKRIYCCTACPNRFSCKYYIEWLHEKDYDEPYPWERILNPDCKYKSYAFYYVD